MQDDDSFQTVMSAAKQRVSDWPNMARNTDVKIVGHLDVETDDVSGNNGGRFLNDHIHRTQPFSTGRQGEDHEGYQDHDVVDRFPLFFVHSGNLAGRLGTSLSIILTLIVPL